MATGYTQTWSKSPANIRCRYVTTFNPATRITDVAVTPQFKCNSNYGSDYRLYRSGMSAGNAGIFGNGENLFELGTNYGSGNYAKCGSATNSWANFNKTVHFDVSHESDGTASFTCGVYGSVRAMYDGTTWTPIGGKNSNSINITNYSVIYHKRFIDEINTPVAEEKVIGTDLLISTAIPSSEYTSATFIGWSTDPNGTVPEYLPGDTYDLDANLDLYSVWQEAGSVHIDNGSSFDLYSIYIDNGSSWDRYAPYIDNGTSWEPYS